MHSLKWDAEFRSDSTRIVRVFPIQQGIVLEDAMSIILGKFELNS